MDVVVLTVSLTCKALLNEAVEKVRLGLDPDDSLQWHRFAEHSDGSEQSLLRAREPTEDLLLDESL